MIEKILERLEAEADFFDGTPMGSLQKMYYCKGVEKAIEIVQEVAKEYGNGWIPCSVRLPKEHEHVLVCFDDCKTICVGYYSKSFGWYAQWGAFIFNDIIAWQPLPAPYQKGE